jgi:hypothetical protein
MPEVFLVKENLNHLVEIPEANQQTGAFASWLSGDGKRIDALGRQDVFHDPRIRQSNVSGRPDSGAFSSQLIYVGSQPAPRIGEIHDRPDGMIGLVNRHHHQPIRISGIQTGIHRGINDVIRFGVN